MILLLALLCACGGGNADNELVLSLREDVQNIDAWSGEMELTADYGQRVYDYSVSFTGDREEGTTLTITAPEEAEGITAVAKEGQTWLDYDGVRLETGPLDPQGLSPMDALPALLTELETGTVAEVGTETDGDLSLLRLTLRDPEVTPGTGRETVFWFDKAQKTLLRAELRNDGATVVSCVFSSFTMTIPKA